MNQYESFEDMSLKLNKIFKDILTKRLEAFLYRPVSESSFKHLSVEIYQTLFNVLQDIIVKSGIRFSNDSLNFVCQRYYDSITVEIGSEQRSLDMFIFDKRVTVHDLDTPQLLTIAALFGSTDFCDEVFVELKRR